MGDIFQLPEDIIHQILSYVKTKKAAQTSMFCKTWYSAWLSRPTLSFPESLHASLCALEYIDRTLHRYKEQNIPIVQLILGAFISDYRPHMNTNVDEWIGIAVQNGVQRLELDFSVHFNYEYALPCKIFEAKSLRELSIRASLYKLKLKKRAAEKVMFNRLQKLHLFEIRIDDDMFQEIIKSCPLIESLNVFHCKGLERIKVTELYYLKEFTIRTLRNQDVEVEAPNLQYLNCHLENGSLKLYEIENLKYLAYVGFHPSEIYLDNLGHKFPQLEDLRLTLVSHETTNISSHSLKHIVVESTKDLMEVNIDAPKMVFLELLNIESFPDLSLTNASSQLVLKIITSNFIYLDTNQFCKLKQFLTKAIRSKISLVLRGYILYPFEDVFNIPLSPVVEVEDIHFRFALRPTYSNFLDALFLTCHPKVIIVDGCHNITSNLYENLIERRHQELKEVKLEIYDENKHQWLPSEWKSLQEASPSQELAKVWFRLEWESTLA